MKWSVCIIHVWMYKTIKWMYKTNDIVYAINKLIEHLLFLFNLLEEKKSKTSQANYDYFNYFLKSVCLWEWLY